jgi:hypothetical protein
MTDNVITFPDLAGLVEFPGAPLPDQPITEADVDKLHSTAFRDLEGDVSDLERMGEISQQLIMQCAATEDGLRDLGLAQFAVLQLAKMLREFKAGYHKRWHGELTGPS